MAIDPFSTHEQALKLRALRSEILASNISNADTPNYKARDFDFAAQFNRFRDAAPTMRTSRPQHMLAASTAPLGVDVQYRIPMQPTLDGNTVETDVEQAAFAENAVRHRASLSFLSSQISKIRYAIRGSD